MSALQKAVDVFGSQAALAAAIGKQQQHVQYWLKTKVPAEHVIPIERATGGKVSRHDLRPDLYPVESESGHA